MYSNPSGPVCNGGGIDKSKKVYLLLNNYKINEILFFFRMLTLFV